MKRVIYLEMFIVSMCFVLPSCDKEDEEETKKVYVDPDKYHTENDGNGNFYLVPND